MKGVLDKVISPTQSAFVPGRHIHDNVIAAFETIHSIRKNSGSGAANLVLKLDISKAYHRVEWLFLKKMMAKLGFAESWVQLILRQLAFSNLQGDPLSPYLFLLCSEGLSCLFSHADMMGFIHGVQASRNAPSVSQLLFADDSLVFAKAEMQEVVNLK
ncbi:putative RNA-directed DNA polymerase [Rosa chinensis]|uniref:Putative RNA-directed DNA polymerase n=1 Tax=Rosa chinensis TaxID=74649 RepID=A0A2P6SFP1_ROSCH|nr:putative RNA-directed DNA polymerase [Rosa chinensis]